MGYKVIELPLLLKEEDDNISLASLKMEPLSVNLSEIIVSSQRHITEIKPSSIKYRTDALLSQSGGTAGDILKNMPSVAMGGSPGHNRDIRFRGLGNAYTKVLINGRDIGLSGNNRETILDQIPASSVESIEIIAVPGAEYQSEGINGIVNIILKENHAFGLTGSMELFAGNHDGRGGALSLSQKHQRVNYFMHYDFLKRDITKFKDRKKNDLRDGNINQIEDAFENEGKIFDNHSVRTGIEFTIRPQTRLSTEYLWGYQLESKDRILDFTRTNAEGGWRSAGQEQKTEQKPNHYHQWFTELEHTLSGGARLRSRLTLQTDEQKKREEKLNWALNPQGQWANFQPARENRLENQHGDRFDWTTSLSGLKFARQNISMGYAINHQSRNFENIRERFNYNESQWNGTTNGFENFQIKETTHALFITDNININRLRINAGLRYEYTTTEGNAQNEEHQGGKSYGNLLPAASLVYNIDKSQFVSYNLGRRIRRPGFKDLNPFAEQKDLTRTIMGNSALKAETAWAHEIGYLKNFKSWNVGANLFYREISNLIQKTISEDENGIITEQPNNTGDAYVAGFELMSSAKPFEFWQFTMSYSGFHSEITSGQYEGDALKDQYLWAAKLINDIDLPYRIAIQFSASAVGPKLSNDKQEETLWFVDMGVNKKIYSNGTLTFRMTDVFNTLEKVKFESTERSINREVEYTYGQVFLLGFKWNF